MSYGVNRTQHRKDDPAGNTDDFRERLDSDMIHCDKYPPKTASKLSLLQCQHLGLDSAEIADFGVPVSRPALSASRCIEIMELLATFPNRPFSISDLVKATKINIASCYAVLNVLMEKGYVVRSPKTKGFKLGPSLIAAGYAAQKANPLVEHAARAAQALQKDLGFPIMLSTIVGNEIVAVLSLEDSNGRFAGMHVGEKLPLMAPIGSPFLAWASDEAVEQWIALRNEPLDQDVREAVIRDLELTRERGYQVALHPPERQTIGSLMAQMANSNLIRDYKDELSKLIHTFNQQMCQPVRFEEDELYHVQMIAAPIFDQSGNAKYNLCIGGFPERLTGAKLMTYADRLSHACLDIMRADRTQTPSPRHSGIPDGSMTVDAMTQL